MLTPDTPAISILNPPPQVCNFVFGQLQADVGGSMYVAGPPGTGKSLAMARLTAQLHDTSTTVVNFNCMVRPLLRSAALSRKAPSPRVPRSVPPVYAANTILSPA